MRLSADGRRRVTLVEAGAPDPERAAEVQVPMLFSRAFGGPADWGFQTVPQPGLDGRVIPMANSAPISTTCPRYSCPRTTGYSDGKRRPS
jgi:choline dehydrogenase-like flavoprotein